MLSRLTSRAAVVTIAAGLTLVACNETPASPDTSLNALGRDGRIVTVPIEVHWGEGSFVVVPFGDPRIPAGTPTEDCPVGEANPELGFPAGFPNGGGFVVDQGNGEGRQLGRLTVSSTRCALQFFPPTDPPFVNFDLRATLTAADGSELFVRNEFARTGLTPPGVEAPFAEIVGGTGRFEGATGWLTPTEGLEVTCTDDSGLCLEGTWSGGFVEGEITMPRP